MVRSLRITILIGVMFLCHVSGAVDVWIQRPHAQGSRLGPIGILANLTLNQAGTAFLVSDCFVLTAAHVVLGLPDHTINARTTDLEAINREVKLRFLVGQKDTGGFADSADARAVVIGNYIPLLQVGGDYALLQLDTCLGGDSRYGHLDLSEVRASDVGEGKLFVAGFPLDRDYDHGIWVAPSCSAKVSLSVDPEEGKWRLDCIGRPGLSGAPVFLIGKDARLKAVAVVVTDNGYSSGAVPVRSFAPNLKVALNHR